MPLVTSEEMLSKAQKGGYAVGAFNVENMEMVKAVIAAARGTESTCDAPDHAIYCKIRNTGNLCSHRGS